MTGSREPRLRDDGEIAFSRVLVAVDFSDRDRRTLRVALALARAFGAQILLLHVIEEIRHLPQSSLRAFYARLEDRARVQLRRLKTSCGKAEVARQAVVRGRRGVTIARWAARHGADLIVVGSRSPDPRTGQLMPGVSHEVALQASCPVLLVK